MQGGPFLPNCEDGLTDSAYFNAVYKEAAELCVYLCKQYNLNPLADGVIIGHYEGYQRGIASNHADPSNWWPKHGKTMNDFRNYVASLMQPTQSTATYKVQIGAFSVKANADAMLAKAKAAGFTDAIIKTDASPVLYRVQIGAFSVKANADAMATKAVAAGFTVVIILS